MKAVVKQVDGLTFVAKSDSNHWIVMDGPREYFGHEAASRPMELLLISLGGCTASDVAAILKKKRVKLDGFEVRLEAERREEHPKVFTKIHLEFIFYGKGIREEDVKRAIELSQNKYCSVSAMLRKAVDISYSYKIVEDVS